MLCVTDDALSRDEAPDDDAYFAPSPSFGELTEHEDYEEATPGEHEIAEAAINFRRLLKQKAEDKGDRLEPQDVVDLIHQDDFLEPWRKWFSKDCLTSKQSKEGQYDEMTDREILDKVIERWNESGKEEIDENDKARFSKKSSFLLDVSDESELENRFP